MDIELFKRRLVETATWCQQYSKAEHRLRSPVIQPEIKENINVNGYEGVLFWNLVGSPQDAVEVVLAKRATLLSKERVSLSSALTGGKLLSYAYNETLTDGGSAAVTNGLFGGDDAPPWDTWVCDNAAIIAWIPTNYISMANEGADWSCGRTLYWLDELNTDFTRQLRAAGLLP